jgi:TolB-like protein/DNA-binding winged helix-turn-helix (wHTH) protein
MRLGEFHFEPVSGRLRRGDECRRLEPQPAKVLSLLAARAGEVVSHDEFRAHVWGEGTYVDFERGLRYCIGQIRGALGDSAQQPRFIETLPKRGYRLLVPVVEEGPYAGVAVSEGLPPIAAAAVANSASVFPWRLASSVAVALALLLASGWIAAQRSLPAEPSIVVAVVPFDNETGEAEQDALARGFSDAVVARLAAAEPKRLAVIGNAAVLFGPRSQRDLQALGRELGAAYVVLGQLQRQEGQTRVLAHLIRVSDQKHLWADRVPQDRIDLVAFEAQVAERVLAGVRSRLLDSAGVPADSGT